MMKQGIWTIYFHVKKNNFWDQQILPEHWLIIQNYFLETQTMNVWLQILMSVRPRSEMLGNDKRHLTLTCNINIYL